MDAFGVLGAIGEDVVAGTRNGKDDVFDVERLIDLLSAFESFREASQSARGNMDAEFVVPTANNTPNTGRPASGSFFLHLNTNHLT